VRENGITFTILRDADGAVAKAYRTIGVPETFLIDRDGIVRHHWIGRLATESPAVRREIAAALAHGD
jgi:peroxiredoxin